MADNERDDERAEEETDGQTDGSDVESDIDVVEPDAIDPPGESGGEVVDMREMFARNFAGADGAETFGQRDRFSLKRPPFWSRPLRLLALFAGIVFFASLLPDILTGGLTLWRLIQLIGLPLLVGGAVAYRSWKLPNQTQEIVFRDGIVEMPKGADSSTTIEVDLRDLRSLMVMVRGQTEIAVLETEHHRVTFTSDDFEEPNGPRLLKASVMERVRRHDEGADILERMRDLEERARAASEVDTPVTYALLAMVAVGYAIQHISGAFDTQFGLLQVGAVSAPLIEAGQWWRLVSGNFLHGNLLHIGMNGMALFFLGMFIERLVGSWRFLLIYLVSALGGAFGSYLWTQAPMSVGASTALYGLIGAFGVMHIKYWRQIPPPYRQTVKWWVVILGLNFGISLLPVIDAAAHFVGMGVGGAIAFLVLLPLPELDPRRDAPAWTKVATAVMTAVFAAGLAQASNYAQMEHPEDQTRVVNTVVERAQQQEDPRQLNRYAWSVALDPSATREQLTSAKRAVESALELADQRAEAPKEDYSPPVDALMKMLGQSTDWQKAKTSFLDTKATLTYRLAMAGQGMERQELLERAIELERQVMREMRSYSESDEAWYAEFGEVESRLHRSQLARFLEIYVEEFGRYVVGREVGQETDVVLESRRESLALRFSTPTRLDQDTEFIVLAFKDHKRLGAFRICLPAETRSGILTRFSANQWSSGIDGETTGRVALTNTEGVDCSEESDEIAYWPTVQRVRGWP